MVRREELIQRTNTFGELLPQVNRIEIPHRNTQELNTGGSVVGFKRFPSEIHGAHILVRLQIEDGGDAGFQPESLNVTCALGMRTKEESGKKLGVIHTCSQTARRGSLNEINVCDSSKTVLNG